MSNVDEQDLIKRILDQDEIALSEFYERYSPRLLGFIRKHLSCEPDVEEIAQDTLFAFLDKARDFTGKSSLNTYLCSIAYHKIVDFYRKKKLKRILFSELLESSLPIQPQSTDPQVIFDNTLLSHKITWILKELKPLHRTIITLKYIEGRSVAEIAKMLTVSFKSAESVLFRARKAFVHLYTGDGS